jgi:hypothetical protein
VIIQSYIPEPDPDSGEIDPASVPNTLPGYLIVTIQLKKPVKVLDRVFA